MYHNAIKHLYMAQVIFNENVHLSQFLYFEVANIYFITLLIFRLNI